MIFSAISNTLEQVQSDAQRLWNDSGAADVAGRAGRTGQVIGKHTINACNNAWNGKGEFVRDKASAVVDGVSTRLDEITQNIVDLNPQSVPENLERDVRDLLENYGGNELCTQCAKFPISACWEDEEKVASKCLEWNTPLARVIYHADWCRLCRILLDTLCLPENDPLQHPEVTAYLQPELEGMSMREWVDKGWRYTDNHWPFGRGPRRQEGATHLLGPVGDNVRNTLTKRAFLALMTSPTPSQNQKSDARKVKDAYSNGLRYGKGVGLNQRTRHPLSCDIHVTIFTSKDDDFPGLLLACLVGSGNSFEAKSHVLSKFRMRVAHPNIRSNLGLDRPLSYGRRLDPHRIDLSVAQSWIHECESKHGDRCSLQGWDTILESLQSLRVIDVHRMCLVELEGPLTCRYAALSYRWIQKNNVKLNYENLVSFMEEGGLQKVVLPQTILDAMEVVKALGERYLWLDALCIIQEGGDQESREQIESMDKIYNGALVTIISATTMMADVSAIEEEPDSKAKNDDSNDGSDPCLPGVTWNRNISQPSAAIKGAHIITPFPCAQDLSKTVWNTRAWTFQERLLSRRLLVFSGNEVIWHCRSMVCREDMRNEDSGNTIQPLQWLNLKPKLFDQSDHAHWVDGSMTRDRHGRTHIVRSGNFAEYAKIIPEYTSRQMTNRNDIIKALEGLLQIFRRSFRSDFVYGLPKCLFDVALLWKPRCRLNRRLCDNGEAFPTWSWAGWEGPVVYDSAIKIERDSDGEYVIGYEEAVDGEEGIRPLLRWFLWDESTSVLKALNEHGLGFPQDGPGFPNEWEGAFGPTLQESEKAVSNLDIGLQKHHLVFRTSSTSSFQLGDDMYQSLSRTTSVSEHIDVKDAPIHLAIIDCNMKQVGKLILDGDKPECLDLGTYEFLLLAESQLIGVSDEIIREEFRFYVVMLVERNLDGTYSRWGLGRVSKAPWKRADLEMKNIVLS